MLEPGVVVTVEPGIYLIESLLDQAHQDGAPRAHIDWSVVEELKPSVVVASRTMSRPHGCAGEP